MSAAVLGSRLRRRCSARGFGGGARLEAGVQVAGGGDGVDNPLKVAQPLFVRRSQL
jgi:hypothetical protein